jgi:hypothetical protein
VVAWGVLLLTGGVTAVGLSAGAEVVAWGVLVLIGGGDVSLVEGDCASPQPISTNKKLAVRLILSMLILKPDFALC